MHTRSLLTWTLFAFTATTAQGCKAEPEETDDTDVDDTAPPEPDVTVAIAGNLSRWPSGLPAQNAEICWQGGGEEICATGTSMGAYALSGVPGNTMGGLRITGTGLATTWVPMATAESDIHFLLGVDGMDLLESYYTDAGVAHTPGHTVVVLQGTAGPPMWVGRTGVTPTLVPSSGSGPYFPGGDGTIDPDATGTAANGVALFVDVDPADGPFTMAFDTGCESAEFGAGVPELEIAAGIDEVFFQFRCAP